MSSLESAVAILRCFSSESPELAVTEVAARTDMPKSTVSRLLQAMAEQGLVEQDEVTHRYRVGLLPFRLGQLYYAHVQVAELVEAELERLVEETGFTGYMGVLHGDEIVILRKRHGRYPVQMVLAPGTRMAAATTAFGKALLARLPDQQLRELLPSVMIDGVSGARTPLAKLLRELGSVRQQRWAVGDRTFPGMCAIGAAVGSADDQQCVGFSLSFPDNAVDLSGRSAIADRVVAVARRLAEATADPLWAGDPALPDPPPKEAGKRARAVGSHRPSTRRHS